MNPLPVRLLRAPIQLFLSSFVLSVMMMASTASAASPFVGSWTLTHAYDESLQEITLPEGSFTFRLKEPVSAVVEEQVEEQEESATATPAKLQFFVKVGNNLRSQITLLSNNNNNNSEVEEEDQNSSDIEVGSLMSTMMMPPQPLYQLEIYLSNTLPTMTRLQLLQDEDGVSLVFTGLGKIVCVQQEE